MAKHKIKEVYGGPYLAESEAIITESRKEKPNYDELIANWETISQGALAFIEKQKEGFSKPVGEFVTNVVIEEEPEEESEEVSEEDESLKELGL